MRLTVSDDLNRSRGTVLFRAIFALPFLVWLVVWALGAVFVAFVNWVATLFEGESPEPLHDFLARFVRYTTQIYAYLYLAAEPLPAFDGRPGYPIDLEIDPPGPQSRLSVAVRIVLVVPAMVLLSVYVGPGSLLYSRFPFAGPTGALALVGTAGLLGWFYALVRGRMPRGLRDLIAYALAYGAQVWSYLLLLTDRYPSTDPLTAIDPLAVRSDPVRMQVFDDDLRRSRLTVFFRLLLAFPHLVWLWLWTVLAWLCAILNWFATMLSGVSPRWVQRFLAAYLRYQLHLSAFLYLIGNPFPGFVGAEWSYPVELRLAARQPQNRWSVLFRVILALPALLLASIFGWLLLIVAVFGWFAALIRGEMPLGLRNAGAFALRYISQTYAYLMLVTSAYPYSGPCVEIPPPPTAEQGAPTPRAA